MAASFIGATITLTSVSDIRYVGRLHSINHAESTISLENVSSRGTENRKPADQFIPAGDHVYEFVVFRAKDVKDLGIESTAETPASSSVPDDPAIMGASAQARPPPQAQSPPGPQNYPVPPQVYGQPGPFGYGPPPPGWGGPHGPPPPGPPHGGPGGMYPPGPGGYGGYAMPPPPFPPGQGVPPPQSSPLVAPASGANGQPPRPQATSTPSTGSQAAAGAAAPAPGSTATPKTSAAAVSSTSVPATVGAAAAGPAAANKTATADTATATPSTTTGATAPAPVAGADVAKAAAAAKDDASTTNLQKVERALGEMSVSRGAIGPASSAPLPPAGAPRHQSRGGINPPPGRQQQQQQMGAQRVRQQQHPVPTGPAVFNPSAEFDFASSNAKFDKAAIAREAGAFVVGGEAGADDSDSDDSDDSDVEDKGAASVNKDRRRSSAASPSVPKEQYYNKATSFFDSISSDLKPDSVRGGAMTGGSGGGGARGGRQWRDEERSRNLNTFGEVGGNFNQTMGGGGMRSGYRGPRQHGGGAIRNDGGGGGRRPYYGGGGGGGGGGYGRGQQQQGQQQQQQQQQQGSSER